MVKKTFLAAIFATLMLVVPAQASLDIDGTPFNLEWDGDYTNGDMTAAGFNSINWSSSFFGNNWIIGEPGTGWGHAAAGWLTFTGNPGGWIGNNSTAAYSKAGGWTAVASFVTYDYAQTNDVLSVNDDTNNIKVRFVQGGIGLVDPAGGSTDMAVVDTAYPGIHTFRVVRQPGSATVELYYDDMTLGNHVAQITPVGSGVDGLNSVWMPGATAFESSWDYFGMHDGATVPEPATMLVLAIGGGLVLLGRRR